MESKREIDKMSEMELLSIHSYKVCSLIQSEWKSQSKLVSKSKFD